MKERIKMIRKDQKLTQQAFADMLNVSKSTIEGYEYGRLKLTERTISDICRTFGVNEEWLRTGEGEMFAPLSKEAEIAYLTAKMFHADENDPIMRLGKLLANLSEEEAQTLIDVANKLSD